MDMAVVKFRQLIDMAIGSPEPGHVNFYALHCLLSCIAEKLNIIDENIDYSKYEAITLGYPPSKGSGHDLAKLFGYGGRIYAGLDPEDNTDEDVKENAIDQKEKGESEPPQVVEKIDSPGAEIPGEAFVQPIESQVVKTEPEGVKSTPIEPIGTFTEVAEEAPPLVKSSSDNSKISLHWLDDRIGKLEIAVEKLALPDDLIDGVAIMKDQLELAMDQLLLLTVLTLSKEPEAQRVQQLHSLAQGLRSIRKANVFIRGSTRVDLKGKVSIEWRTSELQLNETVSENDVLEARLSQEGRQLGPSIPTDRFEMGGCVCYSPEKLLDQLMDLKSDFCLLTNKVNELSARLLQQESQQTLALIQELQDHVRELKLASTNLKDIQDRLQARVSSNSQGIEDLKKNVEELSAEKVDKSELEVILADKVDYNQLQRKVSLDQMLEVQCRIDKKFCEVFRQINETDKKYALVMENLKETLGFAAMEANLQNFKEQTNKELRALQHILEKYIQSTNDDCAAAGGRVKVVQDLACLSCDTTCVMRSMEKSKVGKLPNARASANLSPLITYELGSIRKSGVMGYYRKDEFPHAPHAWMKRQDQGGPNRHAAGAHTTNTARERVEKILLNKN